MKPYYRDSDVTLICSLKEGLALTSYESLSMGVPVISSDVGGQRELIDNSIGRILPLLQDEANDLDKREYKKEEIEQYVKAIVDILKDRDKYKEMSKRCRERIEQGFTKDKMIKKIEKEFIELKEGRGKEKREKISNAINLLPNLIDDYTTLYCEYEINSILSNRAVRIIEYLKDILKFRKSIVSIIRDFNKLKNKYLIKKYLDKIEFFKVINNFNIIKIKLNNIIKNTNYYWSRKRKNYN